MPELPDAFTLPVGPARPLGGLLPAALTMPGFPTWQAMSAFPRACLWHQLTGQIMVGINDAGGGHIYWSVESGVSTPAALSGSPWDGENVYDYGVTPGWKGWAVHNADGGGDGITSIQFPADELTGAWMDLRSFGSLTQFIAYGLAWLDVTGLRDLTDLDISTGSLSAVNLDAMLISLAEGGLGSGILMMDGHPGSPDAVRSHAASVAKATLLDRGWIITI